MRTSARLVTPILSSACRIKIPPPAPRPDNRGREEGVWRVTNILYHHTLRGKIAQKPSEGYRVPPHPQAPGRAHLYHPRSCTYACVHRSIYIVASAIGSLRYVVSRWFWWRSALGRRAGRSPTKTGSPGGPGERAAGEIISHWSSTIVVRTRRSGRPDGHRG